MPERAERGPIRLVGLKRHTLSLSPIILGSFYSCAHYFPPTANIPAYSLTMRISLLALVFATAVSGYGDLGHRTVGYLAEKYLSSTAKTLFDKLLANPHGYDYSDAAVWADSQKNSLPWSCPLHFINPVADKPPVHCEVTWPSDCPAEGCIISALVNFVCFLSSLFALHH